MDIGLFWDVIRRHPRIAALGVVLSLLAGFAAAVTYSSDGLERRGSAEYEATSTLLVTQPGFPYGRSTLDEFVPAKGSPDSVPRFSDPSRFAYLAALYAQLAEGDDVRFLVRRAVGLPGIAPAKEPKAVRPKYNSTAGKAQDGTTLPTVVIAGRATSEEGAVRVTNAVADGLQSVIGSQQAAAEIKPDSRIVLSVIERADDAKVVEPLRPTRSIMLVLLGLIVTVAVVFIVDNVQRGAPAEIASVDEAEIAPVDESEPKEKPASAKKHASRRGKRTRTLVVEAAPESGADAGAGTARRSALGRVDS